jgi:putative membrane protein
MGEVIARASLSALHLLALAIGLGAVFARGRRLRDLRRSPGDSGALARLFQADGLWGLAALLWIATGLFRAFGRVEKQPAFYLRNGFFWVKMALFVLVLLLEIFPMLSFIRWRIGRSRGETPAAGANLPLLIAINDAEVALVLAIPFVAALMARGAWLF